MKKSKFKTTLVKKVREERIKEKEKTDLREKYNIQEGKDVVLIPVESIIQTIIGKLIDTFKLALIILLITLAAIGVLSLVYPGTREILFETFQGWQQELRLYLFAIY